MIAQIADDPEAKQRFEREAKAVAKMTHPNVVTVFDLGYHTDGSPYIAMEYLKGQDLQKRLRQPPPLPLERKVAIIVQVLAGLAHAHQAGIIHRDIKPANIWIQEDGSAKIMDFGVARDTAGSMTGTGNIIGTADYMSPEQVQGKKVDGRSDLFSVGCMLYELITGAAAVPRRVPDGDLLQDHRTRRPTSRWCRTAEAYEALVPILRKALARDLADRYAAAYEFAIDLREWLMAHGGAASHNVLASLVDLEAPTHAPLPDDEAPRQRRRRRRWTRGRPVDIGQRHRAPRGRCGARCRRRASSGRPDRRRTLPPRRSRARHAPRSGRRAPGPPSASSRHASASVLPWVATALALVAVGGRRLARVEDAAGAGHAAR